MHSLLHDYTTAVEHCQGFLELSFMAQWTQSNSGDFFLLSFIIIMVAKIYRAKVPKFLGFLPPFQKKII